MNAASHLLVEKIVDNLIHSQPLLSKGFTRSIRNRTNLNPGSMYVVGLLRKAGMLSMSEIGNRLAMPKPHVTAHIDKLIAEGMVERTNSPKDRRVINISLTSKGMEDFETIRNELTKDFKERVGKLDEDKLVALVDATALVRETLAQIMTENSNENSLDK